jgi:hypothetical protein
MSKHNRIALFGFLVLFLLFSSTALKAQIVPATRVEISNGGLNSILFDNTNVPGGNDYAWFMTNTAMEFDVIKAGGGLAAFRIANTTKSHTLGLAANGVGIGTADPITSLHIVANGSSSPLPTANIRCEVTNAFPAQDRNMLQLWNNGPVIMDFMDTSVSPAAQYQIRTAADRFSFQQFGGPRAGLVIFADGAVRFVANQNPNLTITPSGSVSIVGSGIGGGNLYVGLGTDIGAKDGNVFVKRNIQFNGQLLGPSDRNLKENFAEIDAKEVLAKVAKLPITKWNYKADQTQTLHIGPMAQDFKAAFGLGDSDKKISMMDSDGVALAAIKGLSQIVDDKEKEITNLKDTVKNQAEMIAELAERLERLEAMSVPNHK